MRLDQFIQSFGTELQELFWEPGRTLDAQIEQLEEQIQAQTAAYDEERTRIESLKRKIADDEGKAAWLTQRVEVYLNINDRSNAWQHALQLDRLRQTIAASRSALQRRQRSYSDQIVLVRQLHRRQDRLRDRLAAG